MAVFIWGPLWTQHLQLWAFQGASLRVPWTVLMNYIMVNHFHLWHTELSSNYPSLTQFVLLREWLSHIPPCPEVFMCAVSNTLQRPPTQSFFTATEYLREQLSNNPFFLELPPGWETPGCGKGHPDGFTTTGFGKRKPGPAWNLPSPLLQGLTGFGINSGQWDMVSGTQNHK